MRQTLLSWTGPGRGDHGSRASGTAGFCKWKAIPAYGFWVSRAPGCWASGVSKFRGNIRLSVQRKCHSVKPRWYQMTTLRKPPGIVALEDPQRPCIS